MRTFVFRVDSLIPDTDDIACGNCNWDTSRLFVRADSEAEALVMVQRYVSYRLDDIEPEPGEDMAGQCGDCYAEMLAEGGL